MSDKRKPWEIPVIYNDDRFLEPEVGGGAGPRSTEMDAEHDDERDPRDIEELLRRPDVREEREYECTDTTPIDYRKGPHDAEFGVDDKEFDREDTDPVPYERGPHDEEFGDDDEFPQD